MPYKINRLMLLKRLEKQNLQVQPMLFKIMPTVNSRLADTPIIQTADKFRAKINYRRLTEINSRYYGLSLQRTLT